jgi:outer membrane protein assembly factor BamA
MLVWPYRVVTYPLKLVSSGAGETLEYLDEKKVISRIGDLLGPRTGPFGVLMQIEAGGLSGFGGGVALEHDAFFSPNNRLRLYGTTSVNGNHRASIGLRFASRKTSEVDFGAGYRVRPNARYFGIGYQTEKSDESFYTHRLLWSGLSYRTAIGADLFITGDALLSSIGTQRPRDDDRIAITSVFQNALPYGYGTTTHGVSLGTAITHGGVDETGRPEKGGSRRLKATYFQGLWDDDSRFWTYRLDIQQFIPLWYRFHVLALRTHITWLDQVGSVPIPFQRLMTNDDPDLMRGFSDFRWRDRGMAVLSAEYRWPLWVLTHPDATGLDLYLHTDVGQVFSNIDQISWDNLTFSYGAGVRILAKRGFVLRLEYARSSEDTVWRLRGDQIFQFARGGFFYGRDPVPAR